MVQMFFDGFAIDNLKSLEKTLEIQIVGRVSVLHTDCQGFESLTAHQNLTFRRKAVFYMAFLF